MGIDFTEGRVLWPTHHSHGMTSVSFIFCLARVGSYASNGSGEQMIAFSTANRLPVSAPGHEMSVRAVLDGAWDVGSPLHELFAAAVEATEEAVVNALFASETMVGRDGNTLYAMPGERVLELLDAAGRLRR